MVLMRVGGSVELQALLTSLQKNSLDYFFVIEVIKGILTFKYTGWKIYTFVDECNQEFSSERKNNLIDGTRGVLCADNTLKVHENIIYSQHISNAFLEDVQNQINWGVQNRFLYVSLHMKSYLQRMFRQGNAVHVLRSTYVPNDISKLVTIPGGTELQNNSKRIEIRKIREDFASIVNNHWAYKTEQSDILIREELEFGYGYGVFVEGRIVSWAIIRKFGGMGVMYVVPEFRRHGFASIIASALSRDLFKLGMVPFAIVDNDNVASKRTLEKLGFFRGPDVEYIYFTPNKVASTKSKHSL